MTFEGLGDAEPGEIVGGMTGDGDIVVIDEEFNVEVLGDGKAGGFGIVAFLLGAVRPETADNFGGVGDRHPVHVRPHMAQTTGTELNTGVSPSSGWPGSLAWASR